MQAIINFYNEKIKTSVPKSFTELKEIISQHLMIGIADVNEMIFTSQIANEKKEIKNEKDFQEAIKDKKNIEVDVQISEKSQLFQKEEKNLLEKCKETYEKIDFKEELENAKKVAKDVQDKVLAATQDIYKFAENNAKKLEEVIKSEKVQEAYKLAETTAKKLVEQVLQAKEKLQPKPEQPKEQPKPVAHPKKVCKFPKMINGKPVHAHYICDGCEKAPIVGIRYKCTVCPDFDYCEECEKKFGEQHGHPFLKIRKPEYAPIFINCQYQATDKK